MRLTIYLAAATVFCAVAALAVGEWGQSRFGIYGTTWAYVDHGKSVRKTIDVHGNYVENAVSGEHIDHGTAVMKASRICFTSAMTNDGEVCWSATPIAIGNSMVTVSDKGQKLKVTRINYVDLPMARICC